jgi:hypothetical protein
MVMKFRIAGERHHGFTLWLPLLLVYLLILLPLLLILLPFLILAAVLLLPWGWSKSALLFIPRLCGVLCALRGLKVDVVQKDHKIIYISFD